MIDVLTAKLGWHMLGGAGGVARMATGGALAAALVWAWFTLITVPAAERDAHAAGRAEVQAEWELAAAREAARQRQANEMAQRAARLRIEAAQERAARTQQRLERIANDVAGQDWADRLCFDGSWVFGNDAAEQ